MGGILKGLCSARHHKWAAYKWQTAARRIRASTNKYNQAQGVWSANQYAAERTNPCAPNSVGQRQAKRATKRQHPQTLGYEPPLRTSCFGHDSSTVATREQRSEHEEKSAVTAKVPIIHSVPRW
eukprot:scaffold35167_cov33-Tisochrysis_lutea.AAC.2